MRFALKIVILYTGIVIFALVSTRSMQAGFVVQATSYPVNETPPGSGYPTQAYPNPTQMPPTAVPFTPTYTLTPPLRTNTPVVTASPAGASPAVTPNRLLTEQAEMGSAKVTPPASETPQPLTPVSASPTLTATRTIATPGSEQIEAGRFFTFRPGFFLVGMIYALILGCVSWMVYVLVRKRS